MLGKLSKNRKKSFPSYSTCKAPETGVYVLEAKSLPSARDKMYMP